MRTSVCAALLASLSFVSSPALAVTLDWVTVGDPGNVCDTQPQGCFGAVADVYRISKYETTNAQYAEFLNAVAATDTHGLYNTNMGSGFGGITRSGSPGSFSYSAISGRENMPVNLVSFYDSLRFANWLQNGQPAGAQGSGTTEDGAYTFSGTTIVGSRNPGATYFLTSEEEWYKAAYFNGSNYAFLRRIRASSFNISELEGRFGRAGLTDFACLHKGSGWIVAMARKPRACA